MSLAIAAALRLTSHIRFARTGVAISAALSTTHRARNASNVATLTTSGAHGLFVGASVTMANLGTGYDVTATVISVPTTTTFTYASTGSEEASTADTDGTVTQTATVSKSIKPIATATNWLNLGDIEDGIEIDPQAESTIERVFARQGKLVREVAPPAFGKPMLKFKSSQMIDLASALAFCGNVPSATQFNPNAGFAGVMGWIKGIHVDVDDDSNRMVYDVYGLLKLDGSLKLDPKDYIKPTWSFEISDSTLNTVYIN